ncbi:M15 family metallopeptidase [Phytohalomonas tamaricis]|uniref:M15 family metallopeptidase n=1 Tax=Phytohalomonas tamaricis TaxID=2081032 RepID=UPI000D0BB861|nr:M15 family metallopeptidase [Phytohalomonas tamaricis]
MAASRFDAPPVPEQAMPDWQCASQIPIAASTSQALQPTSLASAFRTHPIYFKLGVPGAVPECFVRTEVYQRLLTAAQTLPAGVMLVVLDGWRPLEVQCHLYTTLLGLITQRFAALDEATRRGRIRGFVALPSDDPLCPSPHLTGAAVDVTLCDEHGLLLDMGTAFDEMHAASHTRYFETLAAPSATERECRERRRMLYHAMAQAGFANLPSEWWHYSFGDQLWAWMGGHEQALFGKSEPYTLEARWCHSLTLMS